MIDRAEKFLRRPYPGGAAVPGRL